MMRRKSARLFFSILKENLSDNGFFNAARNMTEFQKRFLISMAGYFGSLFIIFLAVETFAVQGNWPSIIAIFYAIFYLATIHQKITGRSILKRKEAGNG